MKQIIETNEISYRKRYGISLNDAWNSLPDDVKNVAIAKFLRIRESKPEESLNFEKDHLLRIVIGYGGAECLKKSVDNPLPSVRVIVWEPEQSLFLAGCIGEDIHEFIEDERTGICFGRDERILKATLLKNVLVTNAFHNKMMAIGDYAKADNKDIAFFSSCYIKVAEETLGEGNSFKYFDHLICENWLNAISILHNNYLIGQLFEQIQTKDIPIIIVAAGPSLKRNCKLLKKAKGKAFIVSVTHALKTLVCYEIKPDLIAIKDAVHFDFSDCDRHREYSLISSVYASKEDQNSYNGKVIFWGFSATAGLFHTKRTETYQEIPCGTGSVATDIFSLFVNAGFKTFILVGQDLSYDEEGFSHSDGKKEISEIIYEVEGLYGNTVRTRSDWEYMRKTYEGNITEHPDITVVDATEGGAKINGAVIMTLEEAIDRYCCDNYPIEQWMKQLQKGDTEEKEQIDNWFDECLNDCDTFNRFLERIMEQNRFIVKNWNNKEKWDDSFRTMCKRYDMMYNIVMEGESGFVLKHYCINEIQKYIENALAMEGDENIDKRMELEYNLFSFMHKMCGELVNYIIDLRK